MSTIAEDVRLVTPCCDREVRPVPFMEHATEVADRRCPGCKAKWRIVVRPLGAIAQGFAHQLDWQECVRSMSRHSRELAQIADDLAAEQARHAEVIHKLTAQDRDPFEIIPGERILASFDDVSQRTEVVREGDRCCLQCFRPIAGAAPHPASAPAYCKVCEASRP